MAGPSPVAITQLSWWREVHESAGFGRTVSLAAVSWSVFSCPGSWLMDAANGIDRSTCWIQCMYICIYYIIYIIDMTRYRIYLYIYIPISSELWGCEAALVVFMFILSPKLDVSNLNWRRIFLGLLKPPACWNYEFVHYGVLTFDHTQTLCIHHCGLCNALLATFFVRIYVRHSCKQFCDP